ncbi:MAG: helix-turn-helix domain-containing protein [Candidatus Accumulibacter sp.]|uniref:helix-turn-helix domain-containing protein n=1 Tax=Accumulibacter sp. TaxID=2053492 RepID=UPI00287974EE|nr:helix-turn-helix domain-containing protein [Accumulibacter sp.]MDS4015818.1 helix-turn-helix domain-containing protein [Accumulibacter sp.]
MKTLPNQTASESAVDKRNFTANPPIVRGQCAQVLEIIRQRQPVVSFELTSNLAIPEAAARVHDLRAKGFHVLTTIMPRFEFRGRIRRNTALYSMGSPEWPAPGFFEDRQRGLIDSTLAGLLALAVACALLLAGWPL